MFSDIQQTVEDKIKAYAAENDIALPALKWTAIPFSGEWGISTSFFQTAADEARAGKNPGKPVPSRAQEMAEQVQARLASLPGTSHVEAVKGYLNIYFETSDYARRVIDEVLAKGTEYGRGSPKTDRVMIEYAQPNTHHSFHIGHSRTALLGESLARIMELDGYETIRASYPGDIGLSVITTLWAYDKFHKGQEPEGVHERGQWLAKIYIEANKLLEAKEGETAREKAQREAYDQERRDLYRKWNDGDPAVRDLWQRTRAWSLVELQDILATLGIKIDVWFYESEADEPAKQIVKELIDLGIAEDERPKGGPVIVKIDEQLGLKKEKYRTAVILRNDGTTLYSTKDLALAKIKFERYHVDRSIYVVDFRQELHFQQVFKILELWGFPQASKCYHLSYGFITLPEGAMSSRKGRVILFKDVADEAVRRVLAVESEKSGDVPPDQRMKIASQIGLGALAYSILSVDNTKHIVFNMDEALSFDGRTGPYIQNAHVRASSILKKAGVRVSELQPAAFDYPLTPHEIELIELLSKFPAAVEQAANEYRPLVMASFVYDLANAFHSFYHAVPVMQSETDQIKRARLRLVASAKQVIASALRLLLIEAPDAM